MPASENPLIIQSDRTILFDVHAPRAQECRNALIPFAELLRSPEHLHTYRLSPLSLWNAMSSGFSAENAIDVLKEYSRYDVPEAVLVWVEETCARYGKLRLVQAPSKIVENKNGQKVREEFLYLLASSEFVYKEISFSPDLKLLLKAADYEEVPPEENKFPDFKIEVSDEEKKYCFVLPLTERGSIKQKLLKINYPVKDDLPLVNGKSLDVQLRKKTLGGKDFVVREYQKDAAAALVGDMGPGSGFGTIVLPCGSGKTIVGMQIMSMLKTNTLIVTTNISAVHQWIDELLDKTNLTRDQIAEYTGENKNVLSVTIATYQILTWRPDKDSAFPHFALFRENNWGLVIYDEVHTLPAPVFRIVSELQTVRRVGLTATLVREDGCEGDVFSLVGPKRFDVPWKELEKNKFIAKAECVEVRVDLDPASRIEYATSKGRNKCRIASENSFKDEIVKELVDRFPDDKILVIGQYLSQLDNLAKELNCPIITGKVANAERDKIYNDFRNGKINVLVVSKVANFAIDLPDASIAIQVSGTFGSRQEEAQRLGRILRPKERMSRFFTLITRDTCEEEFGANRQKFLAEQGYSYRIIRYQNKNSFDCLNDNNLCAGASADLL